MRMMHVIQYVCILCVRAVVYFCALFVYGRFDSDDVCPECGLLDNTDLLTSYLPRLTQTIVPCALKVP